VNWLLQDELAREHLDALHRASGGNRPRRKHGLKRPGRIRMALGVKFVGAGLSIAAGFGTARSASDVIWATRDGLASEGL